MVKHRLYKSFAKAASAASYQYRLVTNVYSFHGLPPEYRRSIETTHPSKQKACQQQLVAQKLLDFGYVDISTIQSP